MLAVLLASRAAGAAEVCPSGNDPAAGPLAGGIGPADFGAVPEACGATDASLRLRAGLTVASTMPDYYGSFIGAATLRGRYQLSERSTFSFAADAFNYRYIDNGGLASQVVSAGPATAAFHQMFAVGAETAMSLYARVLLPLDSARQNGVATGLELGSSLRMPAGARWVIDGGVALTAPAEITGGQTNLRFEPAALAEAWLRLRPWAGAVRRGARAAGRGAWVRPRRHGCAPAGRAVRAAAPRLGGCLARIPGGRNRPDRPDRGPVCGLYP